MAKVALLIGVSDYEPGLNPLPGAVKDVDAIQEVLLHPEMGGFEESDILLLKNPERQDVEMAIETLFSGRHKDDLVVLYFSGHGIKDDRGRLYLATRTTRKTTQGELIRSTSVAANFIHDRMSESRSRRQVVILDSCFSGAFAEGLSAKDDGTVDIRNQLGGEGRVVLTSSSSTQYSFEEQGQDLSIYTRFLIEGIKSGEADRDEDEFISIDELHEYASQKVRELQPAMKPEIHASREGFKIRLAKVAPGDPSQRYSKEVARFIHRGDISFVGRRTLDVLRSRLALGSTEAKAIEDEVLEPYRKEFREKLQQYEQVFTELLERNETITEADRNDLQNLQQILGLRNEDTMPIEAQITAQFKTHQQSLQAYEQAFGSAVWQEYPLGAASRDCLRQMQQQLSLTAAEVEAIESRIKVEVETYHQKLQKYERLFINVTQQEYPLSEASRASLRQQQQRLGLKDVEIAPLEAKITTQIETYHQKLQQYEQAYTKATQRKHYPNEVTRKQLQQTWQTLELNEIDVETIESRINAGIKAHQENLRQYEQEFAEVVQQEYPLSSNRRTKFMERYRSLNLTADDVEAIESSILRVSEEYRQKLQQYQQVFRESIQFEYPLSDGTRKELKRFQHILELEDGNTSQIEARVLKQKADFKSTQLKPSEDLGKIETSKAPGLTEAFPDSKLKSGTLQAVQNDSQIEENQNLPFAYRSFELPFVGRMSGGIILLEAIGVTLLALVGGYIYLSYNNPCIINKSISQYCTLSVTTNLGGSTSEPVAISPDNKFLVADRAIREFPTGKTIHELFYSSSPLSIAISPDSKTLVVGFDDNIIGVWNLQTGQQTRDLQGHSSQYGHVGTVAISSDSKVLVSADDDGTVKIWDLTTGKELNSLKVGVVYSIVISYDNKSLIFAGDGIKVFDLATGEQIREFSSDFFAFATLSSDGKVLAASKYGGSINVWDFETGNQLWNLSSSSGFGEYIVISPDGNTLFAGDIFSDDSGHIKVWDLTTGKFIRTFDGEHLAISTDGKNLATDSYGGAEIWQVSN